MKVEKSKIQNCIIARDVRIIEPVNLYGCSISDSVFIGPFVEIQKGVKIGKRSKIQSHSFICELVEIGNHCFIGHGVVFVNDKFNKKNGPSKNEKLWEKCIVEDNVSIGSNATILPIKICSGCVIGAGSVVVKDIKIRGVYAGNPAKLIKKI